MALIKCPRCDLNYIKDTEKLCSVCLREMSSSHSEDETELCSVCKTAPALPGRDVCASCLKEMNGEEDDGVNDVLDNRLSDPDELDIDAVDPTNDTLLPDEIKDEDMEKLDRELSLEQVIEEEDEDDEDNDEEDDESYTRYESRKHR